MELLSVDSKGRLMIPAKIRREIGAREFTIARANSRIVLTPILPLDKLGGKFKRGLKAEALHDREDFP